MGKPKNVLGHRSFRNPFDSATVQFAEGLTLGGDELELLSIDFPILHVERVKKMRKNYHRFR